MKVLFVIPRNLGEPNPSFIYKCCWPGPPRLFRSKLHSVVPKEFLVYLSAGHQPLVDLFVYVDSDKRVVHARLDGMHAFRTYENRVVLQRQSHELFQRLQHPIRIRRSLARKVDGICAVGFRRATRLQFSAEDFVPRGGRNHST